MVMVTRIFRRNFAAYGRLRQETVRKQAVYCRDRDHRNMAPYTIPYLRRIRSSSCRVLIMYGSELEPVKYFSTGPTGRLIVLV